MYATYGNVYPGYINGFGRVRIFAVMGSGLYVVIYLGFHAVKRFTWQIELKFLRKKIQ